MSFQRFRISTTAAPAPTVQTMSSLGQAPAPPAGPSTGHFQGVSFRVQFRDELEAREGTGGGDGPLDDARRYTHRFAGLAAFQAWRAAEEAERTVEFVLSDRHTSKATPPRFKEHVKLVCGRHGKNGRKKYEKKFPGRKRKWESLKIEGEGCPASITYKTFEGTDEVRVTYVSEHSHPVGDDNLPFTKKGRKLLTAKGVARAHSQSGHANSTSPDAEDGSPDGQPQQPQHIISGPSTFSMPLQFAPQQSMHPLGASPHAHLPADQGRTPSFGVFPMLSAPPSTFVSPLPPHAYLTHSALTSGSSPPPAPGEDASERWERLGTLFQSVRDSARTFAFPSASVAALESVLVRLYVESPVVAVAGAALVPSPSPGALLPPGTGVPPAAMQVNPPAEPLTPRTPETLLRRERLEEEESEYASLSGE